MPGPVVSVLEFAHAYTIPIGWVTAGVFLAAALVEYHDRDLARPVAVVAWVLFAAFWFSLIDFYLLVQKSAIEGVGSILAVPLSLWIGYKLWTGRDSLFVLTRAIAVMALIYVPFVRFELLRKPLIEVVTVQTEFVVNALGYHPEVVDGLILEGWGEIGPKTHPYRSTFVFYKEEAAPITYTIKLACTGLGSMALVGGLIAAVRAPISRKVRAMAIAIPVIWVLNIVRNVFISISFGEQYMHLLPDLIGALFALSDPRMVSFIVADRIVAQSLSVLALLMITWLIVKELPELVTVLEDVIYLVSGRDYDLQEAIGARPPESGD
ncbi:MAG: archaeosortase A [Haloarculaceae archaeon]